MARSCEAKLASHCLFLGGAAACAEKPEPHQTSRQTQAGIGHSAQGLTYAKQE